MDAQRIRIVLPVSQRSHRLEVADRDRRNDTDGDALPGCTRTHGRHFVAEFRCIQVTVCIYENRHFAMMPEALHGREKHATVIN